MKIDTYTKLVLTVIAIALVAQVVMDVTSDAVASGNMRVAICDPETFSICADIIEGTRYNQLAVDD